MPDATSTIPSTVDPAIQQVAKDIAADAPAVVKDVETKNLAGLAQVGENAYQEISPLVPTLIKESKAGYKTTEFWVLILWEAATQTELVHLPGTWGKLVAGLGAAAAYILSRGVAKSGVGNQEPIA